jgi:hypothetical protein
MSAGGDKPPVELNKEGDPNFSLKPQARTGGKMR